MGIHRFGLTPVGRTSVAKSAQIFAQELLGDASKVVVVTSDFLRTTQTAEVFANSLGRTVTLRVETALRERSFGSLEGGPNSRYEEVWAEDAKDPESVPLGAESAASVFRRTAGLVAQLEDLRFPSVSFFEFSMP